MKEQKRYVFLDFIRIVSMLLVVLAHCFVDSNLQPHNIMAHTVVYFTDLAVPLFFMISGALILNSSKTYDLKYLFWNRLRRIVVPFILWQIIASVVSQLYNRDFTWRHLLHTIIYMYHVPVSPAFWFIYTLVAFYLVSPFLKAALDHLNTQTILYLLCLWYIFDILFNHLILSAADPIKTIFSVYPQGQMNWFYGYFGYLVLGYLCLQRKIKLKYTGIWTSCLAALIIIFNVISPYLDNHYLKTSDILINAIIPFVTLGIFLICQEKEQLISHNQTGVRVIEFIASLSYGFYLNHGIGIATINQIWPHVRDFKLFILAASLTFVIVLIIKLIPGIKKILL
ncbi:MAG: acyltransferase [Lactobacillus sp.]|uniref:acyltransferase n=1 Tax=Bombilactobacillus bombi TaxID=1303590 RepID=UPI0035F0172B|nr:acyltransferase [Lactobacillus sp.]